MAIAAVTPRDRLQWFSDLGRKTLRYWWLVAAFTVIGGALTLAFVMLKGRSYQSWSTLLYQERIKSQLLTPTRDEIVQRNIGEKYRELLVARPQLEPILDDPELDPFPEIKDREVALDKMRLAVKLEARGGGSAFRIVFTDTDPERAKKVVEKLTKELQDMDESLRLETARSTVDFATTHKEQAAKELRQRELALAGFLAEHPEFAQETQPGQSEGASIRAAQGSKKSASSASNSRIGVLERQRQRIKARLDAPADAPPVRIASPPSAERIAAEAQVQQAKSELDAAKRELEQVSSRFTDLHPTVRAAKEKVAQAQQRLRRAQQAVPPKSETIIAPASASDRAKLKKQLASVEAEIAALQKSDRVGSSAAAAAASTDRIVELEAKHSYLRRTVAEQRERVNALSDSLFRAQMDYDTKRAETGGRLKVIDPAFRPVRPSGPGKTIFMIAGLVLFVGLGFALAIGLALIDDRIYRRTDLDQLDIAVLGVIPPVGHIRHEKGRA